MLGLAKLFLERHSRLEPVTTAWRFALLIAGLVALYALQHVSLHLWNVHYRFSRVSFLRFPLERDVRVECLHGVLPEPEARGMGVLWIR